MKKLIALIAFAIFVNTSTDLHAEQLPGPLVETDWLANNLKNVTILDLRVVLKSFTAKPVFIKDKKSGKKKLVRIAGHIPGARLVNYKIIRTTIKINGKEVKKMLPDKATFEKLMQKSGLNKNSTIVIVTKGRSNGDMTMATRLYWQLKYFGHDDMAILNGGMAQWILDGRKISSAAEKPVSGNWVATAERNEILASTGDVSKALNNKSVQLIDNRSIDQYLGTWKKSYVYDKGHIPGAKVFPNSIITTHGMPAKFFATDQINALSSSLGIDNGKETITYCNSGHLASGSWFIMHELLGNKKVKLYDGSMHEWTLNKGKVKAMTME